MKLCAKCGSDGPFHNSKYSKDGLDYYCKSCRSAVTHASNGRPIGMKRHTLEERLARLEGRRGPEHYRELDNSVREVLIRETREEFEAVKKLCAEDALERKKKKCVVPIATNSCLTTQK